MSFCLSVSSYLCLYISLTSLSLSITIFISILSLSIFLSFFYPFLFLSLGLPSAFLLPPTCPLSIHSPNHVHLFSLRNRIGTKPNSNFLVLLEATSGDISWMEEDLVGAGPLLDPSALSQLSTARRVTGLAVLGSRSAAGLAVRPLVTSGVLFPFGSTRVFVVVNALF